MSLSTFPHYLPGNSVPPKKLFSWRSDRASPEGQNLDSTFSEKDSSPDSGKFSPINMGPNNNTPSDSQNDNCEDGLSPAGQVSEDNPLDFSMKNTSKRCNSGNFLKSNEVKMNNSGFGQVFNGTSKNFGGSASWDPKNNLQPQASIPPISNGISKYNNGFKQWKSKNNHQSSSPKSTYKITESALSPVSDKNSGFLGVNKAIEPHSFESKLSTADEQNSSESPDLESPDTTKAPILAGMLTKAPPANYIGQMEAYNAFILRSQGAYSNGHSSIYVNIPDANPVIPAGAFNYHPSDLSLQRPALALMAGKVNSFPGFPLPPTPNKFECKISAPRKIKERPFKAYNPHLDGEFPMTLLPFPNPSNTSSPVEHQQCESRVSPYHNGTSNMSLSPNSSINSDPPHPANDMDSNHNIPHSNVPDNGSTGDVTDANARKRKSVADSEKDENYYKRRQKNNEAAKRSREARRKKEDEIAQHAMYFRTKCQQLTEAISFYTMQLDELRVRSLALEQSQINLIADNKMLKQQVSQKRCDHCGNQLSE